MPTHRTRRPRAGSLARRAGVYGLPVIDETSAGGLIIDVQAGRAVTAVIARQNRGGRLEWCLPKGHLEGRETAEQATVQENNIYSLRFSSSSLVSFTFSSSFLVNAVIGVCLFIYDKKAFRFSSARCEAVLFTIIFVVPSVNSCFVSVQYGFIV